MKRKSKLPLRANSLFRFGNQFNECQQAGSTIPTTTTITGTTTGFTNKVRNERIQFQRVYSLKRNLIK